MTRFSWFLRPAIAIVFACSLVLPLGGCDGGASKRASQYSSLVGTWQILRVDTNIRRFSLQDTVQIEFLSSGEDGRYYRLLRPSQQNPVVAEGIIDVPNAGVLRMSEGFSGPLLWAFDLDKPNELTTSVRFYLQSRWEGSAQVFLEAIGRSGSARTIEMDLERESD